MERVGSGAGRVGSGMGAARVGTSPGVGRDGYRGATGACAIPPEGKTPRHHFLIPFSLCLSRTPLCALLFLSGSARGSCVFHSICIALLLSLWYIAEFVLLYQSCSPFSLLHARFLARTSLLSLHYAFSIVALSL